MGAKKNHPCAIIALAMNQENTRVGPEATLTPQRRPLTLWLQPADLIVFLAYAAMLAIFGPLHEPWADEAQAWMLSAEPSLRELLFHYLRHEGHPALWYLLLWLPTHLHMSYSLFWAISCSCALAGTWVLLRFAPFPFYLRALLPFTFFLAYQYSVVARSYVLFPLLAFLAAHLYRERRPRPVAMAVVLALLANLSVHGTLLGLVFALAYVWNLKRSSRLERNRDFIAAGAIFAASILFVAVCLWPTVGALPPVSPTINRIIDALAVPEPSPPSAAQHAAERAAQPAGPVLQNTPAAPLPTPAPANSVQTPAAQPGASKLANIPAVLSYAFSDWWPLAVLFEVLVLIYLVRNDQILLALGPLVIAAFLAVVYSAPWHLGLLWVTVISVLWAGWDASEFHPTRPTLQNIVAVYLALLCVLQLPWTYRAFRYDATQATAADEATAAYIKTLPPGLRIAGIGMSTGVQPYFAANPYFNHHLRFGYLAPDPLELSTEASLAAHPDVVVADSTLEPTVLQGPYTKTAEFCGRAYFPHGLPRPGCLSVFVARTQADSAAHP